MTERQYRIRYKIHDREIEVEGDKEFVEKHFEEFKDYLKTVKFIV